MERRPSNTLTHPPPATQELLRDLPRLAQFMAEQPLISPPGVRRAYHACTAGFLLNELVRRVDPGSRTVGQLIRDDIAAPLAIPFHVGEGYPPPPAPGAEPYHVQPHKQPPPLYALLHVWLVRAGVGETQWVSPEKRLARALTGREGGPATLQYSGEKVANRNFRVWHGATENGH